MVPLNYQAYMQIKNGAIDKQVITPDKITPFNEEAKYIY